MKLHFLGTTGYHPNNHRQTACFMLPEMGVVFDAGTGFFRVRDLLQTDTLDIFLSHAHLDHSVGLTFLYDVLFEKEMKRVTVHVAEEKIEVLKKHLYNELLFPVQPNFEFEPLDVKKTLKLSHDATINSFPLKHPGGSHGFRMEFPDRSLAYVTDTTAEPDSKYIADIRDVDTLIHECYFSDGWEDQAELTGHSCLTPVAHVAAAASAKRTFLVHINPLDETDHPLDLDSVADICSTLEVAVDHLVIDV